MNGTRLPAGVYRALTDVGCLSPGKGLLVAFSGGADSTALLSMLSSVSEKYGFSLSAVHIHHGIRGTEADRDAFFCHNFCFERNIPFFLYTTDVPTLAQASGRSLEEEARSERYRLLSEHMENHPDIGILLTAHHADDQAETVLFRLLRGTDLSGLTGIRESREFVLPSGRSVTVCRPLLSLSKQDILSYCAENKISFVTDSTNLTSDCTRNMIRNVLLPDAEKINPSFRSALLRISGAARRDESFFFEICETILMQISDIRHIPFNLLKDQHPAVRSRLLLSLYARAVKEFLNSRISEYPLSSFHIDAMEKLLCSDEKPGSADLPAGIRFSVFPAGKYCSFWGKTKKQNPIRSELLPDSPLYLPDGSVCFWNTSSNSPKIFDDFKNIYKFVISASINSDTIKNKVLISHRSRESNRSYFCGGSEKKVKDALSSHKVPPEMRADIPLFCDDDGILWIPFCGTADRCNPKYSSLPANSTVFYYFCGSKETTEHAL